MFPASYAFLFSQISSPALLTHVDASLLPAATFSVPFLSGASLFRVVGQLSEPVANNTSIFNAELNFCWANISLLPVQALTNNKIFDIVPLFSNANLFAVKHYYARNQMSAHYVLHCNYSSL